MNEFFVYPILFEPVYVEIMWGGSLMKNFLKRDIPNTGKPIAEAWDIVDREEAESIVENGPYSGWSIRDLMNSFGKEIIGQNYVQNKPFPLLVKIIDAGQKLSLQVHPDITTSASFPDAEPKTEMWYIIAAEKNACIYAGLRSDCTKIMFLDKIHSQEIESCLQKFKSFPGDAYFISAGKVHAIGAGNLILEIQQNSNTTYRLSDWGRVGPDGQPRELHVREALECIVFADRSTPRITAQCSPGTRNIKAPIVSMCPYFKVDDIKLIEQYKDFTDGTSFHLLSAPDNPLIIKTSNFETALMPGRTCLLPAITGKYTIAPLNSDSATVLKTRI